MADELLTFTWLLFSILITIKKELKDAKIRFAYFPRAL